MVKISSKVLNGSRSSSKCEWMQMRDNNILRLLGLAGVWGTQLERETVASMLISCGLCAPNKATHVISLPKLVWVPFEDWWLWKCGTNILHVGQQELGGAEHKKLSAARSWCFSQPDLVYCNVQSDVPSFTYLSPHICQYRPLGFEMLMNDACLKTDSSKLNVWISLEGQRHFFHKLGSEFMLASTY